MAVLIAVLTFLVVAVLFLGIWVFASGEGAQEQVRKRMSAVHKAERRGESNIGLALVRDEMLSGLPWLHRLMLRWSWATKLQDYLVQAGMSARPGKIVLLSGVIGVGTFLVTS